MEMIDCRLNEISNKNIELESLSRKRAELEAIYRYELSKELIRLAEKKMKISRVHDVAKDNERIARLKLDRDKAESIYYAVKNSLENMKMDIEILKGMLTCLKGELNN